MNQENEALNDGGSVYPTPITINHNGFGWSEDAIPSSPGLSLRDHFAGLLLEKFWKRFESGEGYAQTAQDIWDMTDALINAREPASQE